MLASVSLFRKTRWCVASQPRDILQEIRVCHCPSVCVSLSLSALPAGALSMRTGPLVCFYPRNAQDAVQNLRLAIGEKFMGASRPGAKKHTAVSLWGSRRSLEIHSGQR